MKHPSHYIASALRSLCARLADAILERAGKLGGPAHAAMVEITEAARGGGRDEQRS
jgi:hypothetical protein